MEMRTKSTTFIIEVDENAHDSYPDTCELARLQTVSQVRIREKITYHTNIIQVYTVINQFF